MPPHHLASQEKVTLQTDTQLCEAELKPYTDGAPLQEFLILPLPSSASAASQLARPSQAECEHYPPPYAFPGATPPALLQPRNGVGRWGSPKQSQALGTEAVSI